jgi:DNA-binding transcriptional regulator YbjK
VTRAERVLDAAIQVVGEGGLRALTHRAVDASADLPVGSTSNLYRSREALLRAMVDRIVTVEGEGWTQLAGELRPTTVDELADALTALIAMVTGPARALSLARYALFVEAARDDELQRRVGEAAAIVAAWSEEWLGAIGSTEPVADARVVMGFLDGVILHRLSYPDPPWDVAALLRRLLRALVG